MNTHKSIFHLNKYQYIYNNNKNKNIKNVDTQTLSVFPLVVITVFIY